MLNSNALLSSTRRLFYGHGPSHLTENLFTKSNPPLFKSEKEKKEWIKRSQSKLNKKDLTDFDVTFLHELLPVLCSGKIAKPGTAEYEIRLQDPDSVEFLIKIVKGLRNDVSHVSSRAFD